MRCEESDAIVAVARARHALSPAHHIARTASGADDASLRRSIGDAVVAAVPVLSGEFLLGVLQCGWSDSLRDVASDVDLVSSMGLSEILCEGVI